MEPLLKIGDKVRVKSKYDPGCSDVDYPKTFIFPMLDKFGGKIVTISSCSKRSKTSYRLENDDLYTYEIVEDSKQYVWTSSMFDLSSKTPSSISIKRKHKTKLKFTL